MELHALSLDIATLHAGYREGAFTPRDVINEVLRRCEQTGHQHIWINRLSREQIEAYLEGLDAASPDTLPLYGIPFAIKDNIDLAGIATTAACPDYAYRAQVHAFAVQRLIAAGAVPIGKTNLDQFATGLVGTRSPYGVCTNSFDSAYIAGGSSAGSAVAVATGLASFALGTDTAGSGRVPAAFNNIVGIKPTRGLLSARGVVPACRSLDCVSIFALTSGDAARVMDVGAAYDTADTYARDWPDAIPAFSDRQFRFGVPRAGQLQFFGNAEAQSLFDRTVERLVQLGGERVEIDFEPFLAAARLLYEGPWVAERYAAIEAFIEQRPESLHPVTRKIIEAGRAASAVDAFKAQYRLSDLRRDSERAWETVDVIVTPTAGTIYRVEEVDADPIVLNSNLGYYTNFMNLLDLGAIAVPAGFQANGLPFGVTLFAPAFADLSLARLGDRLHRASVDSAGATARALPDDSELPAPPGRVSIAVCGAHLAGLPLNGQLTSRGAWLLEATYTASAYRLFALPGGPPYRPGLVRDRQGCGIEVEVWSLPTDQVGGFLDTIPAPLGLGRVELADGRWVCGFICEPCGVEDARDISAFGGWRAYLASGREAQ